MKMREIGALEAELLDSAEVKEGARITSAAEAVDTERPPCHRDEEVAPYGKRSDLNEIAPGKEEEEEEEEEEVMRIKLGLQTDFSPQHSYILVASCSRNEKSRLQDAVASKIPSQAAYLSSPRESGKSSGGVGPLMANSHSSHITGLGVTTE
ncbi:hypothetical protein EYF80_021066 [Liparis tanakae]|uniref:Uncharacterized protein n=1 Tax=Liparis tanakae TaxID=230148 RepID=A0A4Z2HUQ7_9TELE|nr:hypothetical protein EYF80_021066 [Liparis tanakae]